jgi:hypothetical protein
MRFAQVCTSQPILRQSRFVERWKLSATENRREKY